MKILTVIATLLLMTAVLGASQQKQRQEEAEDYYKKWLEQDIKYIISDEEVAVFKELSTNEEKDQFIEQFWFRRDPDPRTSDNEFKIEHYRRIAYANEKYGSGIPGWKTDRGRTYIAFGPPDIIEDHPSGGWYYRPHHEGGGATSTYPFQLWIYNFIDELGQDVEVEFVDPSWSGEYRMAMEPWEKDALLHAGGSGPTDAELEGSLSKLDRPYFNPGNYRNSRMQRQLGMRAKDMPFERIHRFFALQKNAPIENSRLKQLVETSVTYDEIPFRMGYEYLIIDERSILVPITLEFKNEDLTFVEGTDGQALVGGVNIYGLVQNLAGRIVDEFEDTLTLQFPVAERDQRLARKSVYQKMVLLDPGRYKLTLAIRDDQAGRVGVHESGLVLPQLKPETLDLSSVILARALQYIEQVPTDVEPFLLGDFKVIPNVSRSFNSGDDMGLYLQVYNAETDQANQEPQVEVEYQIWRKGKIVKSYLDPKKNSILNYGDRLVLLQAFKLRGLEPGGYTLKVKVTDQIQKTEISRQVAFDVTI